MAGLTSPGLAQPEDPWASGWPAEQSANQISALAVAPSNGKVLYASTPVGLYRSTDGGTKWAAASALPNIVAIAVDPTRTDSVYVYLWPQRTGAPNLKGLRKSADGGRTWIDPSGGVAAEAIGRATVLAIDPANPQFMYVGSADPANYGVSRSTDGGATWRATYTLQALMGVGEITAIAIHPTARNVVYAAHAVYRGGLITRSDDGGASWRELPAIEPLSYPASIAVDPGDSNIVYAAYQGPTGSGVFLYWSSDGGASWTKVGRGLPAGRAWTPRLAIDANNPRVLFMSLQGDNAGIYRSVDGGGVWTRLAADDAPQLAYVSALGYNPADMTLYAGTGQGVWQKRIPPDVAAAFAAYYASYDGWRVLGRPISYPLSAGMLRQYFEKGRLEYHPEEADPNWRLMYGLLVDELQQAGAALPVGGDVSTVTYAEIRVAARPESQAPPPAGFSGGVHAGPDGSTFIPYDPHLRPAPGQVVPGFFWEYVSRPDLFPGGWLHDVGLPMTPPLEATVDKGEAKGRKITIQAFQRTILTYDPLNPPDWKVERANVGADYARAFPATLVQK
ncbi:MAG: hypothetical protein HYX92_00765 [Chloroflexi bacterium]|nr:hypothetical protein [Chloroflexota bacterium]